MVDGVVGFAAALVTATPAMNMKAERAKAAACQAFSHRPPDWGADITAGRAGPDPTPPRSERQADTVLAARLCAPCPMSPAAIVARNGLTSSPRLPGDGTRKERQNAAHLVCKIAGARRHM